ncbi:hypothetical protein [uncultured Roseibium sp.]|uniref:hypothetical protein n=1 Tax=uncultured Roseibium sp. TaxID=1936171 RepID=UPI00261E1A34|nr:hypothetical protein [uncultured Roseibium sp.]
MDFEPFTVDMVRLAHVFTVACGLGGAIATDVFVLKNLKTPLTEQSIQTIKFFHVLIGIVLIPLWISGLLLVYIKTGFELAQFTPKLSFKLMIVSVLTANGLLLGPTAISMIQSNCGSKVVDFEALQLLVFAFFGATSATCWLLALSFGIVKLLAVSSYELLVALTAITWATMFFSISLGLLSMRNLERWAAIRARA